MNILIKNRTLALLLVCVTLFISVGAYPGDNNEHYDVNDINHFDENCALEEEILTSTLSEPAGVQGFEGEYEIVSSDDPVEIIVQFVTPPSVALKHIHERGINTRHVMTFETFENQALAAHTAFSKQLADILPVPLQTSEATVQNNLPVVEILSENHTLFNGVHMRVPAGMVDSIASLPEVFGVFPNVIYKVPNPMSAPVPNNPGLLKEARELLDIADIHGNLNITGSGVKVAVIDSGIFHNHTEFLNYRAPNGFIRGSDFYSDPNPAAAHGTAVSSCVIAIAPGVELWSYRIQVQVPGAGGSYVTVPGGTIYSAIERAYRDDKINVINLSVGIEVNHPFDPIVNTVNLAVMEGVVVVAAAGNSGPDSFKIAAPGTSSLAITAAAGTAGGYQATSDDIANFSSRGPLGITDHIKPDITAPGSYILVASYSGSGPSYTPAYAYMSGTSFSAPIIAGVAALLRQAFPSATPLEIKAMMMNTSRELEAASANQVMNVGAGFVRPFEALTSRTLVTVINSVPVSGDQNAPFENRPMASLSYGEVTQGRNGIIRRTNAISIKNSGTSPRTYSIGSSFTNNPNHAGSFIFSSTSITVPAGGTVEFNAVLDINISAELGSYEGYITVNGGGANVARIPFSAVVKSLEPYVDPVEGFVTRLYRIALGREPDPYGLQSWTAYLKNGTRDGAGVAYGFFFSREMANRYLSNDDFVETLYLTLMDRESDAGGKANWVGQLNAGLPREYAFAGFIDSPEFTEICNDYDITRGTYTPPPNVAIRSFVTRLYREALFREPDSGGLEDWVYHLVNGRTGVSVAHGFIFSQEMLDADLSNEEFVERLYIALMGRLYDAEGRANWVGHLNSGISRDIVFAGFANSPEFDGLCSAAGIIRGTYISPDR